MKLLSKIQNEVSFRNKIFIFILFSMGLQLIFIAVNLRNVAMESLEHQVGTRALIQAKEIASDPLLIESLNLNDMALIEQTAQRRRQSSDSSFIVIGDKRGIRLSHPVKERVGLPMQGADNEGALVRGESYISVSEGSLGTSIRGKSAVIDSGGNIIGVVSVGYLLTRFDEWILLYAQPLLWDFLIILVITLVGAWLFASHIKRNMNGKEPAEIAFAYNMRKSILRSVYEGIIAIDKKGRILTVNFTALEMMQSDKSPKQLNGQGITDYINQSQFLFHTPYEENLKDELISIKGDTFVANRVAIYDKEVLSGWVISFRRKDEISLLSNELTQIKLYTDNLRAIRDEYENKFSTISGLLEMGDSQSALSHIYDEKHRKQETINFVTEHIKCKQVAGILIGKASRARVLGLTLEFSPQCQLGELNQALDVNELSAIIGNLLDNAFEATLKNPKSSKIISLLINDHDQELVIEVKDNGCGIDPELATTIFNKGSSHAEGETGKGVGLYLINRFVTNSGGVIMVDNVLPRGTVFSIFIPK
ncbi:ATP-binding protein [Vibrio sp. SCSIO 43137]|uniref:ATP-binding protein n=1 Tax=Vibrio sp. SCSIO 43137 TaxID=3021011 RepID=UPI002307D0E2|nr:sensor histidine kinase [Vibrio sp. SCSIO 43137]WCE31378.1 sensor histidine kinase [Vibrio sp. SCSIO 43137]